MERTEYQILQKRQQLRDLLVYALAQAPVSLNAIRALKSDIQICDYVLCELVTRRRLSKIS